MKVTTHAIMSKKKSRVQKTKVIIMRKLTILTESNKTYNKQQAK